MATERNNTALEFETMLRRHLKSGGAPVAACAGFDFDTASAYLENALVRPERAGYESHLAGCAACRRHLIELSRLAQTIPHAVTGPTAIASHTPAWVRWREVIAGWFDLTGWNLKWHMVGAAGAAFAILIAALGVQSWRQESKQAGSPVAVNPNSAIAQEQSAQPAAPEPSPQETPLLNAVNPAAKQEQAVARNSVPQPPITVGPKEGDPNVAVAASGELLALSSSQPSAALSLDSNSRREPLAEIRQSRVETQQNTPPQQGINTLLVDNAEEANKRFLAKEQESGSPVRAERAELSNDITARITPPPGNNPMNSEPDPPNPRPARGRQQNERLSSRLYELARGLVPGKSEPEQKAKLEPIDDETSKPLTVRIRNKVFRFDKGMWIDQAYKPEMQRWRVLKVTRGSKDYEQILAADPLLKEFFDQGPILVIWKDKIYKVQ